MSKKDKLIERFLSLPSDLTWEELTAILAFFGYKELNTGKTGGSRRKFTDENKNVISLHKPHAARILKLYAVKEVITHLKEKGKVKDE